MLEELQEWLKEDLTIQELKAKAKELGLPVKKQMSKTDVRKVLEKFIERMKLASATSSSASSHVAPQVQRVPKGLTEDVTLPETYAKDKLVAMPVNPYWIHLYWDLSEHLRGVLTSEKVKYVVLRVYDVTFVDFNGTNAHRTFEIPLDIRFVRNYYLNIPMPGAHYLGELGFYDLEGKYNVVLRSNLCRVPTNGPSQSTRERWLDLKKHRRIVMPAVGMLTQVIERVPGSPHGLEHMFRVSSVGSISFIHLSGKGL